MTPRAMPNRSWMHSHKRTPHPLSRDYCEPTAYEDTYAVDLAWMAMPTICWSATYPTFHLIMA